MNGHRPLLPPFHSQNLRQTCAVVTPYCLVLLRTASKLLLGTSIYHQSPPHVPPLCLHPPFSSDLLEVRAEPSLHTALRREAVYVYGVDLLSTADILRHFADYGPTFVEWINDSSCNVLFADGPSAKRALAGLGKALPPAEGSELQGEMGGEWFFAVAEQGQGWVFASWVDALVGGEGAAQAQSQLARLHLLVHGCAWSRLQPLVAPASAAGTLVSQASSAHTQVWTPQTPPTWNTCGTRPRRRCAAPPPTSSCASPTWTTCGRRARCSRAGCGRQASAAGARAGGAPRPGSGRGTATRKWRMLGRGASRG